MAHSIPLNHIIHRKVTKRELNSHDHYVTVYEYFRLAILRTIQFCIIYVNLQCVAGMQLGAPILCIVSTNTISGYVYYTWQRYEGALLVLSLRYLINCHWTLFTIYLLFNFNCSSRLHWRSISFFILLMNFCISVMLFCPLTFRHHASYI